MCSHVKQSSVYVRRRHQLWQQTFRTWRAGWDEKILDGIWQNQIQWNASPVLSWQIFSLFVFTQRKLASPKTFWLPFTSEPWVFLVYTVLEPLLHLPICQPKICFHMKQKWNYVGQCSFEVLWLNEQNFYFKKKKDLEKSCEISWNLVKSRKIITKNKMQHSKGFSPILEELLLCKYHPSVEIQMGFVPYQWMTCWLKLGMILALFDEDWFIHSYYWFQKIPNICEYMDCSTNQD